MMSATQDLFTIFFFKNIDYFMENYNKTHNKKTKTTTHNAALGF